MELKTAVITGIGWKREEVDGYCDGRSKSIHALSERINFILTSKIFSIFLSYNEVKNYSSVIQPNSSD